MGPTLDELIEQGQQLKDNGLFCNRNDFWQWNESCIEFLEYVTLLFREEVRTPLDVKKGIQWLQETFRSHKE